MGKAINGQGSIRQRKSGKLAGKWRVQWEYQDPITQLWVSVDKTFPTQSEGKTYLDDLQVKVRTGQLIRETNAKKALTLNAWFDELAGPDNSDKPKTSKGGKQEREYNGLWLADGTKPLTIATRASRYNSHVRASNIGNMPIKNISNIEARLFFQELKRTGRTLATMNDVKAVLVGIINDATDTYERLPNLRNVFSKIKLGKPPRRKGVAITVRAAQKAIVRQETAKDRAFLGLLLLGGLRLSEVMAITEEQINFKTGLILIDRAIHLGPTGQQFVGLPKGGTEANPNHRIVVMCPTLAVLLRPLVGNGTSYLFPAATEDQARMKNLVYATWRKVKRDAKYLPKDMSIKDCRLTHNNWIEKLLPTVSTSTRLEHMGHVTAARDDHNRGLEVNLANYTRTLSASQDLLRNELERLAGFTSKQSARYLQWQQGRKTVDNSSYVELMFKSDRKSA